MNRNSPEARAPHTEKPALAPADRADAEALRRAIPAATCPASSAAATADPAPAD